MKLAYPAVPELPHFSLFFRLFATSLLSVLWIAPARAQLTFGASITVLPASASPNGTVSVNASRLAGIHSYTAQLVPLTSGTPTSLFQFNSSAESFQRSVTLPALAVGKYTLELRADGSLLDTAAFAVVAAPQLSLNPATAKAGEFVAFSITGLAPGSLALDFAGAPVFGTVSVSSANYSGKFRVPTDRPGNWPATVPVQLRNLVGKNAARVGSATLSVQAPDTSPFADVISTHPSTTAPNWHDHFNVSGKLAFNQTAAQDVSVSQFWQGADGNVMPMGASNFTVQANGDFSSSQRAPQFGTMSAAQGTGPGHVMTVTQVTDANGVPQFQSHADQTASIATLFDSDQAIDITILLRNPQSQPLLGARVDLSSDVADELFAEPTPLVNIDGSGRANTPTQYNSTPTASQGCSEQDERHYTDAQGRAQFQFTVDPPNGGYNIDGTPVHHATIAPSTTCVHGGSINDPEMCTESDPAGLKFRLVIRSAHLGYGYRDANNVELPVTVDARVDRYTGTISTITCKPGLGCQSASFQNSANLVINQPHLAGEGLEVGNPYFKDDIYDTAMNKDASQSTPSLYTFEPVANLTAFKNNASFVAPRPRSIRFDYHPGAGRPLREAHLLLQKPNGDGFDPLGDFVREGGDFSCDNTEGAETWKYTFTGNLVNILRFPSEHWPGLTGNGKKCGYYYGEDMLGNGFSEHFCLQWQKPNASLLSLTSIQIDDSSPTAVKVTGQRINDPIGTHSNSPPAKYHVGAKDNSEAGGSVEVACTPKTLQDHCMPYSTFQQSHQQFSITPAPDTNTLGGDEVTNIPADGSQAQWDELFNTTIPLFRWVWGVPELLSAEVFADLGLRAQSLLQLHFDPHNPGSFTQKSGGSLAVAITIGVDIDVLFGILVDAGASITGAAISSVVATTTSAGTSADPCFTFLMNFDGWLEIGCPIPNPFDPTCYIPDIHEHYNILNASDPDNCEFPPQNRANSLDATLAGITAANLPAAGDGLSAENRRALFRHPAIAFDSDGNGLALWLNEDGQLVSGSVIGRLRSDAPKVVSTGWGIRDVAVAYLGPQRAVAVWAENSLRDDAFKRASLATKASNQFLRYATWDGKAWSAVSDLTRAGWGEGQVRLARCVSPSLDCPKTGRITAAWQRNTSGDIYAASMHIFTADFSGTSWTAATQVDQSGSLNITPTLAYQNGKPMLGWVRYDPGMTLSDTDSRRFAYRRMDASSLEHVDTNLPNGLAAPALAAVSTGQLALTFTVADRGYGFIGTRQAVFLGNAACSGGLCGFSAWKMRDANGRWIYGERPQLLIDDAGKAVVTLRGLSFGPIAGRTNNLLADDPPGMATTSGDLIQLRSPLSDQPVPVIALSRDGATHFQPVAALDPSSGDVVALSVSQATPTSLALLVQPTSLQSRRAAAASTTALDAGVEMAATTLAPDLSIEGIVSAAKELTPGSTVNVRVSVANLGSDWEPTTGRTASLRLWWDHPQTRLTQPVSVSVSALGAAETRSYTLQIAVPANFHADERQTLRVMIDMSSDAMDLDSSNNESLLSVGGMPMPKNAHVVLAPGTHFTNIAWDAPNDPRVKGYRVYVEDQPGKVRPLGSSYNAGFADITAQFGVARKYYVSTYSIRGVESEKVGPIAAAPAPEIDVGIFQDGFELPN
jgi:hypothetical protein